MILQTPPKPIQEEVALHIKKRELPRWKRCLDICGVLLVAPLIAPLILIVGIYIKLVSRGPILFMQSRVGYGGEDFLIYKLRTMDVPDKCRNEKHRKYVVEHSVVDGPIKKPDFQDDLIPGGKLLRKLAIDELPQLLNVLRGSMSLVGPRPDLMQLEDYEPSQTRRFEVHPGMTGLWQVSGKNKLTFDQMIELDIEYVDTRSLLQDLMILAKTLVVLLMVRNE